MDLTRLAVDAGQFINRAVQYTGESLGQADRTELEPGLEELLARADATKTRTDQIITQTEALLQPSPGARLEDQLYKHLDWNVPPRPRAHEALGDQMTQAGLEMGSNTPYGTALIRCGDAQKLLGETERKFVQSTNIHFLTPLRSFTEGEYRAIQDERKMLLNKRLDLDIANTRVRKAHEADQEARNLNSNPLEDDYIAHVSYMFSFIRVKWLKIWAQEIAQAEMELRICQSLFDRQSEITRRVVEGLSNTHTNHMQALTDFVDAQACYFDQCNQHAQELHKQLASIPAVFCSDNWQSEITNAVGQPSTRNHVSNGPIGPDQVLPIPTVVIHQYPDSDQDSSAANASSGSQKTTTDRSSTTLPPGQANINHSNNNSSEARRAFDHVSLSDSAFRHPPGQNSAIPATDRATAVAAKGAGILTVTTATSQPSETSNNSQKTNAGASETTPSDQTVTKTSKINGTAGVPERNNDTAGKLPAVNRKNTRESLTAESETNSGEDIQELSAASQAVVQ